MNGIQEVSGSIPLISTKSSTISRQKSLGFFFFLWSCFWLDHIFDHNANDFTVSNLIGFVLCAERLAEALYRVLADGILHMEIMLRHIGVGVSYDALDGLDIHAQSLHL